MQTKTVFTVAFALLLIETSAAADDAEHGRCKPVRGTFELSTSSCSAAPAGLCGEVVWHGSLEAKSSFIATAQIATADTSATNVVLVTGDNSLVVRGGSLNTKDAVVFRLAGAGDFAEVDTISGGSGDYAGASGAWRAVGTFHDNQGHGSYEGEICGISQ